MRKIILLICFFCLFFTANAIVKISTEPYDFYSSFGFELEFENPDEPHWTPHKENMKKYDLNNPIQKVDFFRKNINYEIITSNTNVGSNFIKKYLEKILTERYKNSDFSLSIKDFIDSLKSWDDIEIFPIFINEKYLENYYKSNKRKVANYEVIKPKIKGGIPSYSEIKEWFVISNGKKDFLFNFHDNNIIITNLKKAIEEKDEKILQNFFYESEFKEIKNILNKFIEQTEKSSERNFLKTYEMHKNRLLKIMEKTANRDIKKQDLKNLKESIVYVSKIFTIKSQKPVIDNTYSKFDQIKEKLCVSQIISCHKEKRFAFSINTEKMPEYAKNNPGILFKLAEFNHLLYYNLIKTEIKKGDLNRVLETKMLNALENYSKKSLTNSGFEEKILIFNNFKNYYSEAEFNMMKKSNLGKNLLKSIFIMNYIEKNDELYFDSRNNLKAKIYLGVGLVAFGTVAIATGGTSLVFGAFTGSALLPTVPAGISFFGGFISIKTGFWVLEEL